MNISVNGQARVVEEGSTLQSLVTSSKGIAIAVNGTVVPATAWAGTRLRDDDAVEVVTAHQGG